ncbi:bifunctional enoyl-CoA hydratase/phosphate acetyltransferase [Brytella acorum]|uniref:Bifunctional enoyl-CoA hydratase/phosphate acetyltransferase n=1 Tax=Brytella acorum TaxID=2959299 RepID=A0AA35V9G1_9PROT|nr:bifunctional enoyl-CoA hydratase/phosphate acetyltransferase [Brytella acorum]MDF3624893.1 bifunctional enoyl-CoA hydratase/phosphate acetyltransferase [Brytella acorum]CAI9120198.1 bifunctional enoyl-CoA hydratase/phosphate acetyltransferase [Brytella acorum]
MQDHPSSQDVSLSDAGTIADVVSPSGRCGRVGFEALIDRAATLSPSVNAVVWPCEAHALLGAIEGAARGLMRPVLVGDRERIAATAADGDINIGGVEIVSADSPRDAARLAVLMAHEGRVQGLIKGNLHTDVLMREILRPEQGLTGARRVSHVFVLAVPGYEDLLFVTDAAINIFPDLDAKRDIVQNAIDLHHALGLGEPRVAILSAVETVNSRIPGTIDAACLCKMADRGQITGAVLDGPLAMDNAISRDAARIKGIVSPVAGSAQILVAPDLEAGNMLAKNLIFMGGAESAGIVLGASVPVMLSSRADSARARLASLAVGALYARYHTAIHE